MASALSLHSSTAMRRLPPLQSRRQLVADFWPNPILSHRCSPHSSLAFARRRSNASSAITSLSKKEKEKEKEKEKGLIFPHNDEDEEDNLVEEAFEALFGQLEEDLKNDDLSIEDADDDISDEELMKLELELEEAFKDDEVLGVLDSSQLDEVGGTTKEDDEDEEEPVNLKNWQLRRLAYALKNGRRKTSIKNLAADLCLDRGVVLKFLRDPPPNLLLMSSTLPDKLDSTMLEPEKPASMMSELKSETRGRCSSERATMVEKSEENVEVPIHVMQSDWSARKRLKKVQIETLESVYRRSKRPTNAMIMSIVHVTNLPRKRVVKWFEEKRAKDGIPDRHLPYRRSSAETVFSN